jgi:hypothetical protein
MNNIKIKVPHPDHGWVIFTNPTHRQKEILEEYKKLKKQVEIKKS